MVPDRLDTSEDGTWFPCRTQDNPDGLGSPSPPGKIFLHNETVCKFQLVELEAANATLEGVYLWVDVERCGCTWS